MLPAAAAAAAVPTGMLLVLTAEHDDDSMTIYLHQTPVTCIIEYSTSDFSSYMYTLISVTSYVYRQATTQQKHVTITGNTSANINSMLTSVAFLKNSHS